MGQRELKPYKGYSITKHGNDRYVPYDERDGEFESNSLAGIKERIDAKISVRKMSKFLGKVLLPPR